MSARLTRCSNSSSIHINATFVGQGVSGGTTVSATMRAAHMAGIEVFVTGGIGGVHRDVHTSMFTAVTTEILMNQSVNPVLFQAAGSIEDKITHAFLRAALNATRT